MIGKPGGNLVRTYEWHIKALNEDKKNRFSVECIHNMKGNVDISKFDVFWFYAKAFHPDLYNKIKKIRPEAFFICGPNILLDKPDIGPSDEWDFWYVNHCNPNIHLDQVDFYSNHVKKFLNKQTAAKAKTLDKCIKLDESLYDSNCEKTFDCLLYSKKRRYDHSFEDFRLSLIELLEKNNISFCEVAAGKFGSYKREDYFSLLNKSKIMVNLSLDECPGILNYESMFFNVPVIGSRNNVPVNSNEELYVNNSDIMTENYLQRTKDAHEKYFEKITQVLDSELVNHKPRDFVINHTSFERYCDNVYNLLSLK